MQTLVEQINEALNERPSLVVYCWTPKYAAASGEQPCLRAGVRGSDDYIIEPDDITHDEVMRLIAGAYGNVSCMVDDNTVDLSDLYRALALIPR